MTEPDTQLPGDLLDRREAIRRYILSMTKDPSEADDLTQETFLRAQKGFESLRTPAKALPWLYRIATNLTYDRFRRNRARSLPLDSDEGGTGWTDPKALAAFKAEDPRLDLAMEQEEMSGCVQRYVSQLSDSYRAVILLHDTGGLTNPEIAEMLDLPLATVKIRLHRARKRLREALVRACSFSYDDRGVLVCEPKGEDHC